MTLAPLQFEAGTFGAGTEALNSADFTPLALRERLTQIGSSSSVYVAGLLHREPRTAVWSTDATPFHPDAEPWVQ